MRPFFLPALLIMSFIACGVNAQSRETQDKIKQVEENLVGPIRTAGEAPWTIAERMTHYHIPGVSVAVIQNYKLIWAKGYGMADVGLKIPVTTQTLFQAASVSKSLNAVGVLRLVQDRKADLYGDINLYLSSWKFPYDSLSKNKKISIANLLSHTAGINVHGFGGYAKGFDLPTTVQILKGEKPAYSSRIHSLFEPGLRHEYSGGGITVSQLIVIDLTHESYDRYMYNNVLKPLGMLSSTYSQPPVGIKPALLATAYNTSGKEIPGKYHIYPEQAAAGLWTNPADLSKYIIETQLAYQDRSNKVLSPQMARTMLTPYIDKQAALGVFIDDFEGTKYFEHSGANEGFRSQYYGSLENGNGVVVMVNSDNGDIIPEIVNSVAKVYDFKGLYRSKLQKTVYVDEITLQSYTGSYAVSPSFAFVVTREGHQLYAQATGQGKVPVFAESPNKFYLKVVDAQIEFIKDEKGEISKAVLYQGGGKVEATRMK